MTINIEISERDLKNLIKSYLLTKLNHDIEDKNIKIMVKSKQNYKSEWEPAAFKAVYEEAKY